MASINNYRYVSKANKDEYNNKWAKGYQASAQELADKAAAREAQLAYANYKRLPNSWLSNLNKDYDAVRNVQPFQYDLARDTLYQQYKNQYKNLGKLAMQDTMGQAAAMTGGYGNSYASTAGNQAYQSYLQQLNDKVPDLYNAALSKYNSDLDNLYNKFSLTKNMYDTEEEQKDKEYSILGNKANALANLYADEYNRNYGAYNDAYNAFLNIINGEESSGQAAASLAEQQRQFNQEMAYKKSNYESQISALKNELEARNKLKEYDRDTALATMKKAFDGSVNNKESAMSALVEYLNSTNLSDSAKADIYDSFENQLTSIFGKGATSYDPNERAKYGRR